MSPRIIHIGPVSIPLLGLFIIIGILTSIGLLSYDADKKKLDKDLIYDSITKILIFGIIGARVYYILIFNLKPYIENPLSIFFVWQGGLSIQGGILGGIIGGVITFRKDAIGFWKMADFLAPGVILAQAVARIGCDVFGNPIESPLPWGVVVDGIHVHPVQMYESLLNYLLFFILWISRERIRFQGQLFLSYTIGFSLNRFIVEFFRTNPMILPPLTVAHITSIGFIILAGIIWMVLGNQEKFQIQHTKVNRINTIIPLLTTIISIAVSTFIYYRIYWS
ncbi:prolipoprotein diacylglyceryl transferase [Spirochaeta lutea]|uniref:Phosphatidylglycerol--prolipoprotein diacylglyceryl transferase n=1 Tax=Spirochaeta lutea TaxID=1480694 RepID=A0A098QWG7_9SPIO|nr:prolipoprotein diacylglyceryl transferase [Spirochaeta lutea]KGE71753.1 hypothetical protein DC28_10980 [Spirochaeta lutea]